MEIRTGDCLDVLKTMSADSVDAIVTDPPYGLSFMGKKWDYDVPAVEVWAECLRVLKPGGHLLAFASTRTQHRMAVRIEDAGFEIRDMIAWVYGSGFPKSLDVSKAIDKAAGAEREKVLVPTKPGNTRGKRGINYAGESFSGFTDISAPATEAACQWAGWGTALKPALEPITVARKPLIGTVAENVLAHGTGALNVDGCRVSASDGRPLIESKSEASLHAFGSGLNGSRCAGVTTQGRWPANLIHDGSEEVAGLLNDAARFFYCAKASKADRDEGNNHPTVKPTDLMRYLCRLVTPPGGTVLDPFMGSGSTGKAAMLEGFNFIGIERDPEYVKIAEARIGAAKQKAGLF
jgi:site-specific DNA-methyltransferase (adenine-specific)